jgi:predicted restriction endonuclease
MSKCSSKLRKEITLRQGSRCFICGFQESHFTEKFHAHRVVPASQGGKYEKGNVLLACRECHMLIERMNLAQIRLLSPYGEHLISSLLNLVPE